MRSFAVRVELPQEYLAGIGAICFEWSLIERGLQLITYGLLKIGPKHGRVAVRSPRATDQMTMIRQLMELENLTTTLDLKLFSATLGRLEKMRDLVAHCIWLKGNADEYLMQDLSGNWRPNPIEPAVSKRIKPQAIPIKPENLKQVADLIRAAQKGVDQIAAELGAQRRALLDKSQRQPGMDHQLDDQNPGIS